MKIMTEEELRAINPEEFEGKDIAWDNGTKEHQCKFTGRVLLDYDQGLSILEKDDPDFCLTGIHGPAYAGDSLYTTKERYHKQLSDALDMLKDGYYKGQAALGVLEPSGGIATCSFT